LGASLVMVLAFETQAEYLSPSFSIHGTTKTCDCDKVTAP
jgi:hypothetical protein